MHLFMDKESFTVLLVYLG